MQLRNVTDAQSRLSHRDSFRHKRWTALSFPQSQAESEAIYLPMNPETVQYVFPPTPKSNNPS